LFFNPCVDFCWNCQIVYYVLVGSQKFIYKCFYFCIFLLSNLAKSSYRWSPLWLYHRIGKKTLLFMMKSCTEHYIVTDAVPSDEGCAPQLMYYKNSYYTILYFGTLCAIRLDLTQIYKCSSLFRMLLHMSSFCILWNLNLVIYLP